MDIEQSVALHYARGGLEAAILAGLAASGKDLAHLTPADLAPVDEFHIGGRQATADFADQLGLRPGLRLLDIGCGLGGASRYFAQERDCEVVGIDLTREYVEVAESLARLVGLAARVSYRQGSALELPFGAGAFDGATLLHVGMNIEDKARLFAEVHRVLKPSGFFGIYDVMRENGGELAFPVPWASSEATSFVESMATYRHLLETAGFKVEKTRSRRQFAIDYFHRMQSRAAPGNPPTLGLHILMGAAAPEKVANMIANLEKGLIAPTEIVLSR